ncbi:MAG: hypothetical protein JWN90_522 [Parcubacteria group bacterium]|nr:hypothetical protein [Parcubacteria group bacterium]
MLEHDEKIIEMYLIQRLSVVQIAHIQNLSWRKIETVLVKNGIQKRSISEAITSLNVTKFGKKEFLLKMHLSPSEEILKVAGIMLYWGEGAKTHGTVALSNSNPKIIRQFLRFLRIICGVVEDRLHVSIHHYEDHDPKVLTDFWSEQTNIPASQFYKPILHVRKKGTYRFPSVYGTVSVQYSDKKLWKLILNWIEEYYQVSENE